MIHFLHFSSRPIIQYSSLYFHNHFIVYYTRSHSDRGHAQLRELKFNGVVSTSLIFDCYPIIDHFRRVSDNTLMALLEAKEKNLKDAGPYYFWVRK